ncbi:MAG: MFS transporter, partial [Actinobacteria bacterium]|nr:MFS transporter [Actinomycetota bacterium]
LTLAAVAAAAVAAPVGVGLAVLGGSNFPLYLAFLAYIAATVLAILLSPKVDST